MLNCPYSPVNNYCTRVPGSRGQISFTCEAPPLSADCCRSAAWASKHWYRFLKALSPMAVSPSSMVSSSGFLSVNSKSQTASTQAEITTVITFPSVTQHNRQVSELGKSNSSLPHVIIYLHLNDIIFFCIIMTEPCKLNHSEAVGSAAYI